MDINFDVNKVFQERLAASMGLDKYQFIMEQVKKTDVSIDSDFQRTFNGFYIVRRNEAWRKVYYEYFENVKGGTPTFASILTRGVLLNITCSTDIGLEEIDAASSVVMEAVHPDCEIIWGANFDEELEDEMIITVIATRFGEDGPGAPIKSTTASKPVAPPTEIPSAPASFTSNDDDSFNDIVSFFKK